jgi:hypothetical protein
LLDAVLCLVTFSYRERFVGPVYGARTSPLFNLSWRVLFHKVDGCSSNILACGFRNKARTPSRVKIAPTFANDGYVVSTPIILE